jgi:uncharacterized protein (TIGR00290 family)
MSSAGKDCTLALDRARRGGLEVRWLANIYEGNTGRVRFHGVRHTLVEDQARALGLECVMRATHPDTFEVAFAALLADLKSRGCTGVIFGNINLVDVRGWYEERVRGAGLEHLELLWGEPGIELLYEVVERGYHGLIVSVNLKERATGFLGRELDADLVTELGITDELDPCGERGEFHTFVYDGPEFRHPVPFQVGESVELEGHRFLDLMPRTEAGVVMGRAAI